MAIPKNIKALANRVRNEIYGKDVRESIAKSMEATAEVAEWSREVAQQIIDGSFDESALNTEIERKLNELEAQYAPKLTDLTQQLAETASNVEVSFKRDAWVSALEYEDRRIAVADGWDYSQVVQKALDDHNHVFITGDMLFTTPVMPKSNTKIFCDPFQTNLSLGDGVSPFRLTGVTNVIIDGGNVFGSLTGNASQIAVRIENCEVIEIRNIISKDTGGTSFWISNSKDVLLYRCRSFTSKSMAFLAYESDNVVFDQCLSNSPGNEFAMQFKNTINSKMIDCINDRAKAYGIYVSQALEGGTLPENNEIRNCFVINQGIDGIAGYADQAGIAVSDNINCKYDGNTIVGGTGTGIKVYDGTIGTNYINNIIKSCLAGMRLRGSDYSVIGGYIENCVTSGIVVEGVRIGINSVDIKNNNTANSGSYANILIGSIAKDITLSGNKLTTTSGSKRNLRIDLGASKINDDGTNQYFNTGANDIYCNDNGLREIVGLNIKSNGGTRLLLTAGLVVNVPFEMKNGIITYYERSAPPTSGTWKHGDTINISLPVVGGYSSYKCVSSGTPGTWKGVGLIES